VSGSENLGTGSFGGGSGVYKMYSFSLDRELRLSYILSVQRRVPVVFLLARHEMSMLWNGGRC
jgi:hypothetical protein